MLTQLKHASVAWVQDCVEVKTPVDEHTPMSVAQKWTAESATVVPSVLSRFAPELNPKAPVFAEKQYVDCIRTHKLRS